MSIIECLIACGCVLAAVMMLVRVFYGTELTDEAYYVSDAIAMVHGNIPYAYNNYSYGTGSAFLLIPIVFLHEVLVPNNEGVFLFTRICYMLFWYAILLCGYRILIKDFKKTGALLLTGFMIPFAGGGAVFNFGYNMVPCALSYLSGLIIYDAVEHKSERSGVKLVLSGFLMGIALFAHPGYALVIAVFAAVILVRSRGVKDKRRNLLCAVAGGLAEILIVMVPVMIQASPAKLYEGIRDKLYPHPTGSMSYATVNDRVYTLLQEFKSILPPFIGLFLLVFFLSLRYVREKEKKLTKREYALLALSAAMLSMVVSFCRVQLGTNTSNVNHLWGLAGCIGVMALFLLFEFKQTPLLWYLGIYPPLLAVAQIVAVNSNASVVRFVSAVPTLGVFFLVMLQKRSETTRWVAAVSVVACILAMGVNEFRYVYRDEHFSALDYKVESGVYKGLCTTRARANDLPELEEYLNGIVGEGEYYLFRDNVPAGYLMMHQGIMCDKATWDSLNYTYGKNAPAPLYEYFKRRGAFPQKLIYVDYGRDSQLSIELEGYKLNEFVEAYYRKTADFSLNETFSHIVVYEYAGGFDGNFDEWIQRHEYAGS